jgi:ABC-type phosphate transport system substrate-binding protein
MKRSSRTMIATGLALIATGLAFAVVSQQARADVVVIVSAQSSTATITADQISRVYMGKSNTLRPVDLADPSLARREFYAKVVGKDEAQVMAKRMSLVITGKGSAPKELPSGAEVVKAVAADPNAIGYVDRSFVNITVKIVYTVK